MNIISCDIQNKKDVDGKKNLVLYDPTDILNVVLLDDSTKSMKTKNIEELKYKNEDEKRSINTMLEKSEAFIQDGKFYFMNNQIIEAIYQQSNQTFLHIQPSTKEVIKYKEENYRFADDDDDSYEIVSDYDEESRNNQNKGRNLGDNGARLSTKEIDSIPHEVSYESRNNKGIKKIKKRYNKAITQIDEPTEDNQKKQKNTYSEKYSTTVYHPDNSQNSYDQRPETKVVEVISKEDVDVPEREIYNNKNYNNDFKHPSVKYFSRSPVSSVKTETKYIHKEPERRHHRVLSTEPLESEVESSEMPEVIEVSEPKKKLSKVSSIYIKKSKPVYNIPENDFEFREMEIKLNVIPIISNKHADMFNLVDESGQCLTVVDTNLILTKCLPNNPYQKFKLMDSDTILSLVNKNNSKDQSEENKYLTKLNSDDKENKNSIIPNDSDSVLYSYLKKLFNKDEKPEKPKTDNKIIKDSIIKIMKNLFNIKDDISPSSDEISDNFMTNEDNIKKPKSKKKKNYYEDDEDSGYYDDESTDVIEKRSDKKKSYKKKSNSTKKGYKKKRNGKKMKKLKKQNKQIIEDEIDEYVYDEKEDKKKLKKQNKQIIEDEIDEYVYDEKEDKKKINISDDGNEDSDYSYKYDKNNDNPVIYKESYKVKNVNKENKNHGDNKIRTITNEISNSIQTSDSVEKPYIQTINRKTKTNYDDINPNNNYNTVQSSSVYSNPNSNNNYISSNNNNSQAYQNKPIQRFQQNLDKRNLGNMNNYSSNGDVGGYQQQQYSNGLNNQSANGNNLQGQQNMNQYNNNYNNIQNTSQSSSYNSSPNQNMSQSSSYNSSPNQNMSQASSLNPNQNMNQSSSYNPVQNIMNNVKNSQYTKGNDNGLMNQQVSANNNRMNGSSMKENSTDDISPMISKTKEHTESILTDKPISTSSISSAFDINSIAEESIKDNSVFNNLS